MFILALRDRTGLTVAAWLCLTWLFSLLLMQLATMTVSLGILVWSVLVTVYGAWVLLKSRNSLRFNSKYAEEHAFPSTRKNERLVFGLHMLTLLLFYIPGATMLVVKLPGLAEAETRMVTGIAFLIGCLGVAGLALQGLRMMKRVRKDPDNGN
jgi:hypothetical protein